MKTKSMKVIDNKLYMTKESYFMLKRALEKS